MGTEDRVLMWLTAIGLVVMLGVISLWGML
jgi:hypothetical protein